LGLKGFVVVVVIVVVVVGVVDINVLLLRTCSKFGKFDLGQLK
jgi:hypothetical protein